MNQRLLVGLLTVGLTILGWFVWMARDTVNGARPPDSAYQEGSQPSANPSGTGVDASAVGAEVAVDSPTELLASPEAARNVGLAPATGPRPLSPSNEKRLELFANQMAEDNGRFRDFYTLARAEAADPEWSEAIEMQIQQSVAIHGAKFTGIQTKTPHCSRTVCMLVATGGAGTEVANADWQRLMGMVMSETWFRENFSDTQTSVHPDRNEVLYISFFIRKS